MNKTKGSIKTKTSIMLILMIVLFAAFLFSLIFTIGGYSKQMRFYTQNYYRIVRLNSSANEFAKAVEIYTQSAAKEDKEAVSEAFADFRNDIKELYSIRFRLDGDLKREVENINEELSVLSASLNSILTYDGSGVPDETETAAFGEHMGIVMEKADGIYLSLAEEGIGRYEGFQGGVKFVQVLMVFLFIGFGAMTVYALYFVKNRIAKPIADTCEWARVFKDGYCEMSDLKFNTEDEMSLIAESFNIVKNNLAKANALKAEYEKLMQKIYDDEEHKKKFVQQLYDEKREKEAISTIAKRDGLTGLYNRRTFDGIVDDFVAKKPLGTEGALFIIDMDNFKNVNDTLGHLAGDEALKTLAGMMRIVFHDAHLGRYGGDEFIVFLAGYGSDEELEKLAADLCARMDMTFEHDGKSVGLSVSVGIATTIGVEEYSELYMQADRALYYSKENGRNQYKLASTLE